MFWFSGSAAFAQPRDAQLPVGETVADRPSAHYRFERFIVQSPDHTRRWRITLGIPNIAAPQAGFPAFWMLDGNAALQVFSDSLLKELIHATPHVLVFVGYDNQQRIDTAARTRDYTPSVSESAGGGANAFLQAIEQQMLPEVTKRAPIDLHHQTLWGHSFGGLFVLHALYQHSFVFQVYASASPSLWWGHGMMLGEPEKRFFEGKIQPAHILLMAGGRERQPEINTRDLTNPRVIAHMKRVSDAPPDAVFALSKRLQTQPALNVEYREFKDLSHGPMLPVSLLYALHVVSGVEDHSSDISP